MLFFGRLSAEEKYLLRSFSGHTGIIRSVNYAPDGKTIASGSMDHSVKIWDAASGKCLKTLSGHTGWVKAVNYAPDGKFIASGSEDNTVKIWEVLTGNA